jgi:dTDP-4-dehydrorhamnose 3,5-epimerase
MRELSFENKKAVFIPKGFAHGFVSKTENSMVAYMVSESYDPTCDIGIRYDSF